MSYRIARALPARGLRIVQWPVPSHGPCWSQLWTVGRCDGPSCPRCPPILPCFWLGWWDLAGKVLPDSTRGRPAAPWHEAPWHMYALQQVFTIFCIYSLRHIKKVWSYIVVGRKKYWSEIKTTWPASTHCLRFPPCLHTDSYLNDLKEEKLSKKKTTLSPHEPSTILRNRTPCCMALIPQGSWWAIKPRARGAGSVARRAAGGCLGARSRSPYGAGRMVPTQAALRLTDS